MKNRMFMLLGVLCVFVIAGCGKNVKVTGKVTFSDGSPLTVGTIYFTNGTVSAYGKINGNGAYKLGMIKEGDGIPPGSYQIYFTGATQPSGDPKLQQTDEDGKPYAPQVLVIAPKYSTPEKSGLSCEVKGVMKHDITIEKPGPNYKPVFSKGDPGKS
ncbi:MAG: hypothetical protein LBJ67_00420 [Planctomycetaceae bacterium]|nr:hypothetical protein [Planctomycetaceae bacterium]